MSYLKELKVAVINEDIEKLKSLLDKDITFSSLDEAKEINSYIKQAINLLTRKKKEVFKEMQQIKKLKKFNSQNQNSFFDIKS